jgi:Zn finger protein HypA/HybF involved in hydrogenase expression
VADWGGLGGIIEEARKLDEIEKARPHVDCPKCGTLLQFNRSGVGGCPMGHYRTAGS